MSDPESEGISRCQCPRSFFPRENPTLLLRGCPRAPGCWVEGGGLGLLFRLQMSHNPFHKATLCLLQSKPQPGESVFDKDLQPISLVPVPPISCLQLHLGCPAWPLRACSWHPGGISLAQPGVPPSLLCPVLLPSPLKLCGSPLAAVVSFPVLCLYGFHLKYIFKKFLYSWCLWMEPKSTFVQLTTFST